MKTVTLVTHGAKATGFTRETKYISKKGPGHWAIIWIGK